MKKIDLGQTVGILANIGVIAGIVFLALELQQNNELMEAEARAASSDRRTEIPQLVSVNTELANILVKAKNGEPLTEAEELRVIAFNVSRLRGQEAYFREYQAGNNDSIPVDNWKNNFQSNLWSAPSQSETWSRTRDYMFDDFVQYMEENVVNEH